MDWNQLQQIVNATDSQYASGNDQQKQEAVRQRDSAVAQYEQYKRSLSSPAPPQPSYQPSPAPPPAPILPRFTAAPSNKNIKTAPSDIIQFDNDLIDIALIQDLLFEDIGAVELANMSRTDLIDGQESIYSPIKNLSSVRREFNPNNIVATSYEMNYFSRFGIDIDSKGIREPYFDDLGNLIIEVDTVGSEEEIQVQILSDGTIDTVNEV